MTSRPNHPAHAGPACTPGADALPTLCPADASAFDAWVEAGFDLAAVPAPLAPRAAHAAALLAPLDAPSAVAASPVTDLIDGVWRRVAAHAEIEERGIAVSPDGWESRDLNLIPDDEDALEALVAAGFDPARTPGALRQRAHRHARLLALLDTPSSAGAPSDAAGRDRLVAATLERVQLSIDSHERRLVLEPAAASRSTFRLSDLASVAAIITIGAAVVWPVMGAVRDSARRAACKAGLGSVAQAFNLYGGDYTGSLPMASASVAGVPWWNVGTQDQSNSANLFTLVRSDYADAASLACAGNARGCGSPPPSGAVDWDCVSSVSYSYRLLFTRHRPRLDDGRQFILLVDRSPVVLKAKSGQLIDPLENSPNHGGRGQAVLFSDGRVVWTSSPFAPGTQDNMWLPRSTEEALSRFASYRRAAPLRGTEEPSCLEDAFVGP